MKTLSDRQRLFRVKLIHTIIWIFFNIVIGYLAYAVIVNRIGLLAWIAIGLVVLEGMVLLIFGNHCPLTIVARKYSDSPKNNFDIFLPEWLAKYNKLIYTSIFLVIMLVMVIRKLG